MKIIIRADRPLCDESIRLAGFVEHDSGRRSFIEPLAFTDISPGQKINEFARLTEGDAQQLMDELWNVGLRPSQGKGSAGQLEATRAHLEDMRKLVFKP